MKPDELLEKASDAISEKSPSILTGLGIGLFVTTAVLAAGETPKAQLLMQEKRSQLADADVERPEIEKAQVMLAGGKAYIPCFVTGGLAIFCLLYANKIHIDREAALIGAYTIADKSLSQYKTAIKEKLGEKKSEEIHDEVARMQLKDNPVRPNEIIVLGDDQHLCLDSQSGRYFRASVQQIREAEYQVNKEMVTGMERVVFLDTFYEALKLPTDARIGEVMGWDLEHGDRLEIRLREGEASNGQPCWVLDYDVRALVVCDW